MKNKILLKSLFLFALIFTISSSVYASEVTGTLPSSGIINNGEGNNSGSSSSQGGSLAGTVIGGNIFRSSVSSGSFIARNTGSVLGASTVGENSQTIDLSSSVDTDSDVLYSDMNADYVVDQPFIATTSSLITNEISNQTALSAEAYNGLSFSNWLWIILLILLLVITVTYFYVRSFANKKQMK